MPWGRLRSPRTPIPDPESPWICLVHTELNELGVEWLLSDKVGSDRGVVPRRMTRFRWIHRATPQPSTTSWIPTFSSLRLSGTCCSPRGTVHRAESQGLSGHLRWPLGFLHSIVMLHGAPTRRRCSCVNGAKAHGEIGRRSLIVPNHLLTAPLLWVPLSDSGW